MNARKIKVACIQLRSSDDIEENIEQTSALIREAHADGARFIATPENTCLMAPDGGAKLEKSFAESDDPALPAFCALANELDIWLLIGSLAIKVSDDEDGEPLVPDRARRTDRGALRQDPSLRRQSALRRDVSRIEHGRAGRRCRAWRICRGRASDLSVCYDLRFPQLYRTLAKAGAEILTVPVGIHGDDRQGALARAAARPRDRERVFRHGARLRAASTPMAGGPMATA